MSVHGTIVALDPRAGARRAPIRAVPGRPEPPPAAHDVAAPAAPAAPDAAPGPAQVSLGLWPAETLDPPDRVRLRIDCLLPVPSDEVLMRRLAVELRAARPDPERLLRLALRLLAPDPVAAPEPGLPLLEKLTPRERRVAQLATEGLRNKEIARRLCRSVRTVECQLSSVLRKLRIGSRHQLMRLLESELATGAPPEERDG